MGILLRVQGSYLTYVTLGEEWHTVLQARGWGISFFIMFPFQFVVTLSVCIAWSLSNFQYRGLLCLVSSLDIKGAGLWEVIKALLKYWSISKVQWGKKNPLFLAIACKLFYDMYLAILIYVCLNIIHHVNVFWYHMLILINKVLVIIIILKQACNSADYTQKVWFTVKNSIYLNNLFKTRKL